MDIATGSLVIIDANTTAPKVFWNGILVEGIIKIVIRNDEDDSDVKFVVNALTPILESMKASGINVKVRGEK